MALLYPLKKWMQWHSGYPCAGEGGQAGMKVELYRETIFPGGRCGGEFYRGGGRALGVPGGAADELIECFGVNSFVLHQPVSDGLQFVPVPLQYTRPDQGI